MLFCTLSGLPPSFMFGDIRNWFKTRSVRTLVGMVTASVFVIVLIVGAILSMNRGPYDFTQHQKVSASAVLRLSFPEEMNQSSVEQFLSLPVDMNMTKTWKDGVLLLQPPVKLSAGRSFMAKVDARALKADGQPLGREIIFTFDVTGAPVVTAAIPPTDSVNVPVTAKVVIVFDRPMVPLAQVQDPMGSAKPASWPVSISPTIHGRWRWLGTTSVQFASDEPLKLATKYTVTVPAGIKTISGDVTEKDFSWSFETARPQVLSSDPSDGSEDAGPTTKVTLHFDQEMNLPDAKDSISITGEEKGAKTTSVLPIGSVTYGTKKVDEQSVIDKSSLIVKPARPFAFESSYAVTVAAGMHGLQGELGSATASLLKFNTVGPLSATLSLAENGSVTLHFSNPIDDSSLVKAISFSPFVNVATGDLVTQDWNQHKELQLYSSFEPSTKYTATINSSLKDIFGQKLQTAATLSWLTPQLSPAAFIHPKGNTFSIFERGKTPMYYLNGVNVSSLDVQMGEVPMDRFLSYRQQVSGNYGDGRSGFDMEKNAVNVQSWHVKPKKKLNLWESIPFDLEKKWGSSLKPGIYAIALTTPESDANNNPIRDQRMFSVTNMSITLKYSGSRMLTWVTDLETGDPVSGADIELHSLGGKVEIAGKTNKEGFFEGPIDIKNLAYGQSWQPEFWVVAKKGDDFTFVGSDWNPGSQPYNFDGVMQDFRSPQSDKVRLLSTVYAERPVYRVGDTVHLKGIVRYLDWDGKMTSPAGKIVQLKVTDPSNNEIYSKELTLTEFGTFNDSFPIDPNAPLGYYSINGRMAENDSGNQSFWGSFQVLAYHKPEYRVTVAPETADYFNGETVKATISGQYYFGAPMDSANVEWRAVNTDFYFNRFTDGWYSFGTQDGWCWRNCDRSTGILTQGKGVLDADGNLAIQFPVSIDDKKVSQVLTIEADITDKNNQVVSSRTDVIVHKSKVYVGIKSDDYVVTPGDKAKFSVVTVNPDGSAAKNQSVQLSLYSRVWNSVKQQGVDGEYYYDNTPVDTFIKSVSLSTNENGKGTTDFVVDQGGEYSVTASVKDVDGRTAKAATGFYAWSDTYFNWPHTNNDRVEVVVDKPTYKVGDIAKLLVKSPYQGKGVKALVTVERENVISHKVVDVTSNALPIEVPITDDLLPTAYVSVVIVKPRMGETFNEFGLDTSAPAFKVGYAKLPIDISPRRLTVKIRTDKEKYLPGEKVTATLETTDAAGNPVPAELSLGVVDLSLLDLTGFQMPDLVQGFYADRGLGVITSNMLAYLMERFKPGSKGGDGSSAEEKARGNFKDTAFWKARVFTDKNGLATTSFNLPDNLTTWQLLALGSTKNNLFGGDAKTVVETKHVILRPVQPRFAVVGDTVMLGAIVHNYLDDSREFTVTLSGKGFTPVSASSQKVTIAKDGNQKVEFPVKISDVTGAVLRFSAQTEGARDEIFQTIPVYLFGVPQTNATAGMTETTETEALAIPTKTDAPFGMLSLRLAPSIAVYLPKGLQYLAEYPYGCAEQTVSSFLPNVVLKKLQGFDSFRFVSDATLEKNIRAGLEKLYAFQQGNGGFGYWKDSRRTYPGLTAYILYALSVTKDAGYSVDAGVLDRAKSYLDSALHSKSTDSDLTDRASRSYILYVLSEVGNTDLALLNNLLKQRIALPIYAKAYLAMAFDKAGTSGARGSAKSLVTDILTHAQVDARGAQFSEDSAANSGISMNTNDRTTAIALQALLRIDPANPLIPKIVRGLLSSRENGHWDTTQSTVASLLAFIEYVKQTHELEYDFTSAAAIDDKNVMTPAFPKGSVLHAEQQEIPLSKLERGKTVSVKVGKEGKGKLYYDLALSYFYTPDVIQPTEEGIGILREMKPLAGKQSSVAVGNTYKVTLTISVPETRHFVAVESPLPAGMEAIDLHLATSQQNLLQDTTNNATDDWWDSPLRYFSHIEFRDDRVFLFADELPPGVYVYEYLARATTPGTFHVRPAKAWEMYFPETFGQTRGDSLTIGE